MKLLPALPFFLLIACTTPDNSKETTSILKDSTRQDSPRTGNFQAMPQFTNLTNNKEIIGIWLDEGKEPLTVKIEKDSIYYIEHFESYKYRIDKDSIYINYPDFAYSGRIGFRNDTLVMISSDGEAKYIREKN